MNAPTCTAHHWQLINASTEEVPDQPRSWSCAECSQTSVPCLECGGPVETSLQVCQRCVWDEQSVLNDVMLSVNSALTLDPYSPLHSPVYDRDRVARSEDDTRLPFGLDAYVTDPDDPRIGGCRTVPDALAILEGWVEWWAKSRGLDRVPSDTIGFLKEHILWAMQNQAESDWKVYAGEARQVRGVIRRLLGLAPVTEPVPCVHCGGRIVRHWTEEGLAETHQCSRCGLAWENAQHIRHTNTLVLKRLPETHPELLVTLADANVIYGDLLNPTRVYKWADRGHLEEHGRNVRGLSTFRLGDIEQLYQERLRLLSTRAKQ